VSSLQSPKHTRAFSEWQLAADQVAEADRALRQAMRDGLFLSDRAAFDALVEKSQRLRTGADEKLNAAISAIAAARER
jgi:hypothetical protein